MDTVRLKLGVLAIQGGFSEHIRSLERAVKLLNSSSEKISIEARIIEIRNLDQINDELDGLIIPGGESTVMRKHLKDQGYLEKLIAWTRLKTKFTWGTCAGLILLSNQIIGDDSIVGGLDITCARNAFGRQADSFETNLSLADHELKDISASDHCPGVFIRAPHIKSIDSKHVTVLSRISEKLHADEFSDAVGVRQNNVMACTFHPELTDDSSWHKYFIKQVIACKHGA